jgi:putative DNA primase/helicase
LNTFDTDKAEEEFRSKIAEAGLVPPDRLIGDGKIHRIDADGKPHKKDGFYVYHTDGIPAGAYGNWIDGKEGNQTWCAASEAELSAEERKRLWDKRKEDRAAREKADAERKTEARDRARRIWEASEPVDSHPYLSRKGVQNYGLHQLDDGRLAMPLKGADGEIQTLQYLLAEKNADGKDKLFLKGGTPTGTWFEIGTPGEIICIAEGYATAATVHAATGYCTLVACDCGNLKPVALITRDRFPEAKIVLCSDDDWKKKGNPGKTKADEAAEACNGIVAFPEFGKDRAEKDTDFNDLQISNGLQAVGNCIAEAVLSDAGPMEACDLFPLVMAEIYARKSGKSTHSLLTGIESVNRLMGGLRRSGVTIVAAAPSKGKTAAAAGIIAYNVAHDVPCLLFSIEMDRTEIGVRFVSIDAKVPAVDILDERKELDLETWKKLMGATGRLERMPLIIDDRPLSMNGIVEASHRWFAKKVKARGLDMGLIAIDYLGLIASDDASENRNREVAKLSRTIKTKIAKALRIPVILVAQLNRESSKRGGDPQMSDLRDSGEIEANADQIIFVCPWARDEDGRKISGSVGQPGAEQVDKWIIAKNRNGRTGAAQVSWNPYYMHYTGLEHDSRQPEPADTKTEPGQTWATRGDF